MVYFTRRFVLCLAFLLPFFFALCFLFLCFSVLLALRLPLLGKRELVLVLFIRLFDLRLFGFVCFLFLLVSGKGCGFVLILLFVALWFILRGDLFYVLPCVILFLCFSVLLALREERASLSAFRTFVRFVLVWFCRFPLPLGVWEGLRFVIVALPGLFSYLFLWLWHSLDFSLTFFFYNTFTCFQDPGL